MKITRQFVYTTKPGHNSGWLLADKPHFDPVSMTRPHVLVHDIIEHTNWDGDSFEYELMALGATYFTRVYGGWSRFLRHDSDRGHWTQHQDIFGFLHTEKYNVKPIRDGAIHPDLQAYYEMSLNKFKRTHALDYGRNPDIVELVFKWVSKGYVRAMNQFAGHDAETVYLKLWEPLWHYFGGRANSNSEDSIADDWTKNDNRMTVTYDTVTLEWDVSFEGVSHSSERAALDDILAPVPLRFWFNEEAAA